MIRLFTLICALCATEVCSGAWPRAQGKIFVSLSHRYGISTIDPLAVAPTQYTALYLEYGATEKLTLGIDMGRSVSGGGKVLLFAGWPVLATESGHRIGVQLGIGQIEGQQVIRPGLSYGFGFQNRGLGAWVAVDAAAEMTLDQKQTDFKLDATFGLSWPSGIKAYSQLQTGQPDGDIPFARIAGVIVLPNRLGFSTEFGLEYGVYGDDTVQMKMGIWREF